MITFVIIIAILDIFAGEFGSIGTSPWLLSGALLFSVIGLLRGTKLLALIYDTVAQARQAPTTKLCLSAFVFVVLQVLVVALFLGHRLPPDDPWILASAVASTVLPSIKGSNNFCRA